jgi:hypothetical protein
MKLDVERFLKRLMVVLLTCHLIYQAVIGCKGETMSMIKNTTSGTIDGKRETGI